MRQIQERKAKRAENKSDTGAFAIPIVNFPWPKSYHYINSVTAYTRGMLRKLINIHYLLWENL